MPRENAPPPPTVAWGLRPETPENRARCWMFEDSFEIIPRAQWRTTRRRQFVRHIYDQLDGMCTSNAAAGMVMAIRAMSGLAHKVLVPPTLYEQHSRWGTGSSLGENIDALTDVGICDADFCGGDQVRLGAVAGKPWKANAARYKILPGDVWNLRGQFAQVATAIMLGFFPIIGLDWPGGHCVLATDLVVDSDGVALEGPNSWGADWNGDGFWRKSEAQCRSMPGYGAYAARAVVES